MMDDSRPLDNPTAIETTLTNMNKQPRAPSKRTSATATATTEIAIHQSEGVCEEFRRRLKCLENTIAKGLIESLKLDASPLGIAREGTGPGPGGQKMLDHIMAAKRKHPNCLIAWRNGRFYEFHGVDAVLTVEILGLHPVRGPLSLSTASSYFGMQDKLNRLVAKGLSVAVYEQYTPDEQKKEKVGTKRKLKQIVTPASPNYVYAIGVDGNVFSNSLSNPRPIVGVMRTKDKTQCVLSEVHVESRQVVSTCSNTLEGIKGLLHSLDAVTPIYLQGLSLADLGDCYSAKEAIKVHGQTVDGFPEYLLRRACDHLSLDAKHFRKTDRPGINPLDFSTAAALGLVPGHNPSMVDSMVPDSAPQYVRDYLKRICLTPPVREVRHSVRQICHFHATDDTTCLPAIKPMWRGTRSVSAYLEQGCPSQQLLRNVQELLQGVLDLCTPTYVVESLTRHLFIVAMHYRNSSLEFPALIEGLQSALSMIQKAIPPPTLPRPNIPDDFKDTDIERFLNANDEYYGKIQDSIVCPNNWLKARQGLVQALLDFYNDTRIPSNAKKIKYVVNDNILLIEGQPLPKGQKAMPKVDRTTQAIEIAVRRYRDETDTFRTNVSTALQALAFKLHGHVDCILAAVEISLVHTCLHIHSVHALEKGWALPVLDADILDLKGAWPYWMSNDTTKVVTNDVPWRGLTIITAPNMAGKTTLMRTTGTVALLGNLGFFVPAKPETTIPYFEVFLVYTGLHDKPLEGKSSYHIEAQQCANIGRHIDNDISLLAILDELGKGTTPDEGAVLAVALMEDWARSGNTILVSTHLWEEIRSIATPTWMEMVTWKCLEVEPITGRCLYFVKDGVCDHSNAFEVASTARLPAHIVEDAEQVMQAILDQQRKGRKSQSALTSHPPLGVETKRAGSDNHTANTRRVDLGFSSKVSPNFDRRWVKKRNGFRRRCTRSKMRMFKRISASRSRIELVANSSARFETKRKPWLKHHRAISQYSPRTLALNPHVDVWASLQSHADVVAHVYMCLDDLFGTPIMATEPLQRSLHGFPVLYVLRESEGWVVGTSTNLATTLGSGVGDNRHECVCVHITNDVDLLEIGSKIVKTLACHGLSIKLGSLEVPQSTSTSTSSKKKRNKSTSTKSEVRKDHSRLHMVLDTETTGLRGTVIQLGFVLLNDDGAEVAAYSQLWRLLPGQPFGAEHIHGISQERLGAEGQDARAELMRFFRCAKRVAASGGRLVAHNAEFDYQRLVQTAQAHDVEWPPELGPHLLYCTMRQTQHLARSVAGKRFFRNAELYCHLFGEQPKEGTLHDALVDARITAQSYAHLIKQQQRKHPKSFAFAQTMP